MMFAPSPIWRAAAVSKLDRNQAEQAVDAKVGEPDATGTAIESIARG
jgi:hypothetical protein